MRTIGGCLSTVVVVLVGCVGETPGEQAAAEWAASCHVQLDCLLTATTAAEAAACDSETGYGFPWVYDLNWCALTVCEASCQGDLAACKSCIAAACPEPQSICDGFGSIVAYLDEEGQRCDFIWACWGHCADPSDMECLSACYWQAAPSQRAAFQRHAYQLEARCHGLCETRNAGCDWCFEETAPVSDCVDPWR